MLGSCSLNDPPGGEGRLSIATGGSGGVYQVYGGGVAKMLSENGHDTTAETTSASVDNLYLVADGDTDVAFSLADTAIDAVKGQEAVRQAGSRCARSGRCTRTSRTSWLKDSGIARSRT